ncbi:MAG TPA: wax ester/triacylglycerol synthase family O-acyltransferase [Sporichthyaceae bacterium]|nr:wax ester/triacylglycerol synthase family O-acyltransferase [Sporichthyaceae bacterium]
MDQLNALDQQFLAVENATHTGHVAGVYLLDPSALPAGRVEPAALRALIAERLPLMPPMCRRLIEVPWGLDRPYWIRAEPDLTQHVREHTVDPPGDERALTGLIAALHSRALSREHPLWELHLIHGLAEGRQAVYGKVHHATVDGISAGAMLATLLDRTPAGPGAPAPAPGPAGSSEAAPHRRDLVRRGLKNLAGYPGRSVRSGARLLPHFDDLPGANRIAGSAGIAAMADRAARLVKLPGRPADVPARRRLRVPPTPFNAPISARRVVAFSSIPIREVRAVRTAHGCSENDVVLAICADVLRHWLVTHHALPDRPLVVGVPVSLRGRAADASAGGNQISLMIAPLPTDRLDPAARLRAVAEAMLVAKRRQTAMPEDWLSDVTDLVPAMFAGVAARRVGRVLHGAGRHPVNLLISYVPGPHIPLYLAGARMVAHYPVSAISDAFGALNITVVGHDGDLDFGFVACPRLVPDLAELAARVPGALADLRAAALG